MADYEKLRSLDKKVKTQASTPSIHEEKQNGNILSLVYTTTEKHHLVSKEANLQSSLLAKKQTSKLPNQQTTKEKKKYGTYLRVDSIQAIQLQAIQSQRKDHEIVQEAIDLYFERLKT